MWTLPGMPSSAMLLLLMSGCSQQTGKTSPQSAGGPDGAKAMGVFTLAGQSDMVGLGQLPDTVHYDAGGLLELGRRYAEAYLKNSAHTGM